MLISNETANKRLASGDNLINRLRSSSGLKPKNAMSLFIKPAPQIAAPQVEEKPKPVLPVFPNPFERPGATAVIEKIEVPKDFKENTEGVSVDNLMEEASAQVKLGLAHNSALDVLAKAVKRLGDEVESIPAGKLPAVITATAKVVEGIRKERLERDKIGKDKEVHYHFYTPNQKTMSDYEVIDVTP